MIDEVHLVQDWGGSSFRLAFRLISLVHARMPRGTMISLTATLLAGQETSKLLKTLGLAPSSFFSNDAPTFPVTCKTYIAPFAMDSRAGPSPILIGLSKAIAKPSFTAATLPSGSAYASISIISYASQNIIQKPANFFSILLIPK